MTDGRTFVKTAGLTIAGLAIGMKSNPSSLFPTLEIDCRIECIGQPVIHG